MDTASDLECLIKEVGDLRSKHIDSCIEWYQSHSKIARILFRLTGYVVVILSISIPFLTTVRFHGSDIVVSVVALLIAALTGISSFAKWDSQWRGYKNAQFALETLRSLWELQIVEARHMNSPEAATKTVMEATRKLLENSRKIITSETERYFDDVRVPQTIKR